MRTIVLATVLTAALAGCLDGGAGADAPTGPFVETTREVGRDAPTSGPEERREAVVEDAAAWRAEWARLHPGCGGECPDVPAVDFSRERVLVVQAMAGDPCHGVEIRSATTNLAAATTTVVARPLAPADDMGCIAVVAYPWHAVAVAKRDTRVEWRWEAESAAPPSPGGGEDPGAREPAPPSLRELARGQHSAVRAPREVVVESDAEWAALWREHAANVDPPPERPVVDFARERVVGVWWGEQTSGGYVITVAEVVRDGEALVAHVVREAPRGGGGAISVMTQPHHLVAVPAGPEPVSFRYSDS